MFRHLSQRRTHWAIALFIVALLAVAVIGLVTGGLGQKDRAYELEQRLRCPVCKSVSIAESPSQTAEAMRVAVAQQVAAGRTDQQVVDYFRARYGDWVLLDPPTTGSTLPLWLLPLAVAAAGGIVLFAPRRRPPAGALTAEQRDQALRDLQDLERQVADREIPDDVADNLRRQYEATAAAPIDTDNTADEKPAENRLPRARLIAYLAAGAVAVLAAVLLPTYLSTRPAGGAVTGNEVLAPAPSTTETAPDFSAMSDTELAAAVAANPSAIGIRLALAGRYLAAGEYDKATDHYAVALQQDPENPEALAGAGWLLFKTGKTEDALRFVDQALLIAPESANASWYKANILLDGRKDPAAALAVLRGLAGRGDLPGDLRPRVDQLITTAEQAGGR